MKVLIVAEQLDIQDYLRKLSPDPAIHFFQYTHPLKAMDNLEEIHPSLILWNIDDFPRHWKSFLPYCHALFPTAMPQFHLISETEIQEEEAGKAEALLVTGLHTQGFFSEGLADLFSNGQDLPTISLPLSTGPAIPPGSGIVQLLHPELHKLVIGKLLSADQKTLAARFGNEKITNSFTRNLVIEHAFFRVDKVSAQVMLRLSAINPDGTCLFLIMQFL